MYIDFKNFHQWSQVMHKLSRHVTHHAKKHQKFKNDKAEVHNVCNASHAVYKLASKINYRQMSSVSETRLN